jgi:hypothetical protein
MEREDRRSYKSCSRAHGEVQAIDKRRSEAHQPSITVTAEDTQGTTREQRDGQRCPWMWMTSPVSLSKVGHWHAFAASGGEVGSHRWWRRGETTRLGEPGQTPRPQIRTPRSSTGTMRWWGTSMSRCASITCRDFWLAKSTRMNPKPQTRNRRLRSHRPRAGRRSHRVALEVT